MGRRRGEGRREGESSGSVLKKTAQQIAGEMVLARVVSEVDGASFSFR